MSNAIKGSIISLVAIISFALLGYAGVASAETISPNSMGNWYLYNDQSDVQVSDTADHGFVLGPTGGIGVGSVHLTKTTNDKYGVATDQFAGTPLSDITSLSYSTYRTSGTSAQAPSLGFDVDSDSTDADTGYQGRLTYEPYFTNTVDTGAWQTWNTQDNAGSGNWWFSRSTLSNGATSVCTQSDPCTWTELTTAYPNASISGRFILRTNGADNEAFDGNVDNLTFNGTTYDFDPSGPFITNDQGGTFATLQAAIDGTTAGGTVSLASDITTNAQVTIDHAITLDGNGHKLSPNFAYTDNSNNAAIGVIGAPATVTIKNLTIDGTNGTNLHGINTWESGGVDLESVTVENSDKAGVNVNGTSVSATNLITDGNGWGAINVDPGSGVTMPSILTLNDGVQLNESKQIWSDGDNVTAGSPEVTVNATGYDKYLLGGTEDSFVWSNQVPEQGAVVEISGQKTLFTTIQAAVDAATASSTVLVGQGTYNENVVIGKSNITLQSYAGSAFTTIAPTSGTAVVVSGNTLPQPDHGTIDGVTLQGFTLSSTSNGIGFMALSGTPDDTYYTTNLTLRDIKADGIGYGIVLSSVDGAVLDNVTVSNMTGTPAGALELTGVAHLEVTSSSFTNNQTAIRVQSTTSGPGLGYGPNGPITITDTTFVGNVKDIDDQDGDTQFSLNGNQYGYVDTTGTTTTETTSSGDITMEIQPGTVVTGPEGWNGVVNPPATTTSFTLTPDSGFTADAVVAIEVGDPVNKLTFDTPVKLTFEGQADKLVGWSRNGTFEPITATCDSSTNPTLGEGADCKVSNDGSGNLVVWTKHFTAFVVYTQTEIPAPTPTPSSGGGGGNGPIVGGGSAGGSVAVALPFNGGAAPTGNTNTGSTNTSGTGQVLGAETYNFTADLTIGSTGADVTALQQILIAEGFDIPALTTGGTAYGYFGSQTKAAVIKYQAAHGVSPQSGYVGPLTRAELNKGSTPTMSDEQRSLLIAELQAKLQTLLAQIKVLLGAQQ